MTLYSPISFITCRPQMCCRQQTASCFLLLSLCSGCWKPLGRSSTEPQLSDRNKTSPTQSTSTSERLHFSFSCCLSHFSFSLPLASEAEHRGMRCSRWGEGTNRQWFTNGVWSVVGDSYSEDRQDFAHKLEFEVSKGRITQVLHQVSAILWLLAPGQKFGWLIIWQLCLAHHISTWQPPNSLMSAGALLLHKNDKS